MRSKGFIKKFNKTYKIGKYYLRIKFKCVFTNDTLYEHFKNVEMCNIEPIK